MSEDPILADQIAIVLANQASSENVGAIFADAGLQAVTHPTTRRVDMRIDFDGE